MIIETLGLSFVWIAGAGGLGGSLNAVTGGNCTWWPSRVEITGTRRIARIGLLANTGIGTAAAVALARLLSVPRASLPSTGVVVGGCLVGWLAARCITNQVDMGLLRAALWRACSAPAVYPDTARAMAAAPPHAAYVAACNLAPPVRWTGAPDAHPSPRVLVRPCPGWRSNGEAGKD